jgi:hypothetical protein
MSTGRRPAVGCSAHQISPRLTCSLTPPSIGDRIAKPCSFVLVESTERIARHRISESIEIAPLVNDVTGVLALDRPQGHLRVVLAPSGNFPQQLLLCRHTTINGSHGSG